MTGSKDNAVEENQSAAGARRAKGEFVRGVSGFRGSLGSNDFPAVPNQYHLYVALNCPWCHRVTLARNILGLQQSISMDVVFPNRTQEHDPEGPNNWQFFPERIATVTGAPLPECTAETGPGRLFAWCATFMMRRAPQSVRCQFYTIECLTESSLMKALRLYAC